MSKLLILVLLLFVTPIFGQSFLEVDDRVAHYPKFNSLEELGIRIQNDFNSDANRVRAAFTWIALNLEYKRTLGEVFEPAKRLRYLSDYVKKQQIRKLELELLRKAFQNKRGVCIEFSLLLNELCAQFGLQSKVIHGVLKTTIKDLDGKRQYKNHAWNAVLLGGKWELMDVTLASGYWNAGINRFVRKFMDYYFLTSADSFMTNHYPANEAWQLSEEPLGLETFFSSPILYPQYFTKAVKLAGNTKGIIVVSRKNAFVVSFDELPKRPALYYRTENDLVLKKAKVKRKKDKSYFSKIRLGKHLKNNEYVTLFLQNEAIINFRVRKIIE